MSLNFKNSRVFIFIFFIFYLGYSQITCIQSEQSKQSHLVFQPIKTNIGDTKNWTQPFKPNAINGEIGSLLPHDGKAVVYSSCSTNWASTLYLFENLTTLKISNIDTVKYKIPHQKVLSWHKKYPIQSNKRGSFFGDILEWSDTQINSVTMALYVMMQPTENHIISGTDIIVQVDYTTDLRNKISNYISNEEVKTIHIYYNTFENQLIERFRMNKKSSLVELDRNTISKNIDLKTNTLSWIPM